MATGQQARAHLHPYGLWLVFPGRHERDVHQAPFQDFTNSSASNKASNLSKPFPTTTLGFELRTPDSQLSHRIAGPAYKVPVVQQWNVAVQLTLLRSLTLDVGYVGSRGTHLQTFGNRNFNQPALASPGHPVNCGLPNTASS